MWIYPHPAQAKPIAETKQVVEQPKAQVNESHKKTSLQKQRTNRQTVRRQVGKQTSSSPSGGAYSGRNYSKEEVEALIRSYSQQYGANENLAVSIAFCESGYNQFSANKHSSARGVFQWLSKSWANQPTSQHGSISPLDADKNVSAAVWLIAHGQTSPWNASKKCWSKQLTT